MMRAIVSVVVAVSIFAQVNLYEMSILSSHLFQPIVTLYVHHFYDCYHTLKQQLAALVGPVALFAAVLPRFIFYGSNRYIQML
jgi:hypothetical protein